MGSGTAPRRPGTRWTVLGSASRGVTPLWPARPCRRAPGGHRVGRPAPRHRVGASPRAASVAPSERGPVRAPHGLPHPPRHPPTALLRGNPRDGPCEAVVRDERCGAHRRVTVTHAIHGSVRCCRTGYRARTPETRIQAGSSLPRHSHQPARPSTTTHRRTRKGGGGGGLVPAARPAEGGAAGLQITPSGGICRAWPTARGGHPRVASGSRSPGRRCRRRGRPRRSGSSRARCRPRPSRGAGRCGGR